MFSFILCCLQAVALVMMSVLFGVTLPAAGEVDQSNIRNTATTNTNLASSSSKLINNATLAVVHAQPSILSNGSSKDVSSNATNAKGSLAPLRDEARDDSSQVKTNSTPKTETVTNEPTANKILSSTGGKVEEISTVIKEGAPLTVSPVVNDGSTKKLFGPELLPHTNNNKDSNDATVNEKKEDKDELNNKENEKKYGEEELSKDNDTAANTQKHRVSSGDTSIKDVKNTDKPDIAAGGGDDDDNIDDDADSAEEENKERIGSPSPSEGKNMQDTIISSSPSTGKDVEEDKNKEYEGNEEDEIVENAESEPEDAEPEDNAPEDDAQGEPVRKKPSVAGADGKEFTQRKENSESSSSQSFLVFFLVLFFLVIVVYILYHSRHKIVPMAADVRHLVSSLTKRAPHDENNGVSSVASSSRSGIKYKKLSTAVSETLPTVYDKNVVTHNYIY